MKLPSQLKIISLWFVRTALAVGFLSAVADRFGLWGAPGAKGVAWGNWENFVAYSASLNWFVPSPLQGAVAVLATAAEVILAIGLFIPRLTIPVALLSCLLLLTFGSVMVLSLGMKAPLDYSVFSAAAAALLLAFAAHDATEPSGSNPNK